ncbi:unnamed protein product [Lymnaea stagnalis]|uniref:Uncharacterized protein n=1 Tax=Lymnaea stagnalis TaxID=6523 RepID=A0AAV2HV45_LYMST
MPRVSYDQRCKNDSVMSAMVVVNLLVHRGPFVLYMCGRVGRQEHCTKSDYLNRYGEHFRFHCPQGGVITAVEYQYSEADEDGLFRITCCKVKGKLVTNCNPWKESGGFKQYVRVSHMDDAAYHPIPAVTGVLSKPSTREGADYHYKTREFIVLICNLE